MKKRKYIISIIGFYILIGLFILVQPSRLLTKMPELSFDKGGYELTFIPDKDVNGYMNIYMLKIQSISYNTAEYYGSLFKLNYSGEDEENYYFKNGSEYMEISKYLATLRYVNTETKQEKQDITDEALLKIAENFLDEKSISIPHEEIKISQYEYGYVLEYIEKLSGIKNYAFPTTLYIDKGGNITELHYYFVEYQKINTCRVKSLYDAYMELPTDFTEYRNGEKIILNSGNLVYYYDNSIVQPCYLFEGELTGGRMFECYVKAPVYK